MYSYDELNNVELSPTKKDYYQIWNELIDVSSKLSERWTPGATNESDPGIVLLKVLTAVADKLNYNIDANTLEAFMPSAAQDASMRKLCEMLGYNMRYYQSSTTIARISYQGTFPRNNLIKIDAFTNLKDKEGAVNYITLAPVFLTSEQYSAEVECLEGELVQCETDTDNIITLDHLDDNYRYFLPELQVASNGIFVCSTSSPSEFWTSVDNLNTHLLGEKIFKFGYDASMGLPYIQFAEDISALMGPGLNISFVRTKGLKGNISVGTLCSMEKPASWSEATENELEVESLESYLAEESGEEIEETSTEEWTDTSLYTVYNINPARTGKDPETIDEAYWGYQKTIGTFDTLVTCRDYMNKIYQMTKSSLDTTPLVSNIIVSDIRDDINRSTQICSITPQGVEYTSTPIKEAGREDITHFDLVLYPFNTVSLVRTSGEFNTTFKCINSESSDQSVFELIKTRLEENKTISHSFNLPDPNDIACIKVYFQLSARITTVSKVSVLEAAEIEEIVFKALYENFNLRHLNFGEELPFDSILRVMEQADSRIKNVNLEDPEMYVAITTADEKEYPIFKDGFVYKDAQTAGIAKTLYTKLLAKNLLSGKLPLYNYNDTFKVKFEEKPYPAGSDLVMSTSSVVVGLGEFDPPEQDFPVDLEFTSADSTKTLPIYGFKSDDPIDPLAEPALLEINSDLVEVTDSPDSETTFNINGYDTTTRVIVPNKTGTLKASLKIPEVETASRSRRKNRSSTAEPGVQTKFLSCIDEINVYLYSPGTKQDDYDYKLVYKPTLRYSSNGIDTQSYPDVEKFSVYMYKTSNGYIESLLTREDEVPNNLRGLITFNDNLKPLDANKSAISCISSDKAQLDNASEDNPFYPSNELNLFELRLAPGVVCDKIGIEVFLNLTTLDKLADLTSNAGQVDALKQSLLKEDTGIAFTWAIDPTAGGLNEISCPTFVTEGKLSSTSGGGTPGEDTSGTADYLTLDFGADPNLTESQLDNITSLSLKLKNAGKGTHLPKATKISSAFLVDTDRIEPSNPLVLKEHEVIQFRSPNFKTAATYPAYVNYYVKLSEQTRNNARARALGRNTAAVPATMYTLREFLNGGPDGYEDQLFARFEGTNDGQVANTISSVDDLGWNPAKSLAEKNSTMPKALKTSLFKNAFKTTGTNADHANLALYVVKHGAVYYKDQSGDYQLFASKGTSTKDGKSYAYKIVADQTKAEEAGAIGTNWEIKSEVTFYFMKPSSSSLKALTAWLQGTNSSEEAANGGAATCRALPSTLLAPGGAANGGKSVPAAIVREKPIKGLYTRARANLSRKPGLLVDEAQYKYTLVESLSEDCSLDDLFVPILHLDDTATHTKDGLGVDASTLGIPANTEYALAAGEFILINYSSSEGSDSGTSIVKNVALGPGSIVKANFELIDSELLASTTSFAKTSDYGPWAVKDAISKSPISIVSATQIPGMFSLGATEQIEERVPIKVTLDGADTLLCWELNDKIIEDGYEYFPVGPTTANANLTNSYILKTGEYVFYTNAKKESMAYYGAGTEIKRKANTPVIRRQEGIGLSLEKIAESGLVSALPWTPVNLSGVEQALEIAEYQLITLTKGDTLSAIDFIEEEDAPMLTNNFKKVRTASYITNGQEATLPLLVLDSYNWEASSKLELALDPETPQTLNVHKNKYGAEVARDMIYLLGDTGSGGATECITQVYTPLIVTAETAPGENVMPVPMRLYSNVPIASSGTAYTLVNPTNKKSTISEPLQIKACAAEELASPAGPFSFAPETSGFANVPLTTLGMTSDEPVASHEITANLEEPVPDNLEVDLSSLSPSLSPGSYLFNVTNAAGNLLTAYVTEEHDTGLGQSTSGEIKIKENTNYSINIKIPEDTTVGSFSCMLQIFRVSTLSLNTVIPKDYSGLLSILYEPNLTDTDPLKQVWLTYTPTNSTNATQLSLGIMSLDDPWWSAAPSPELNPNGFGKRVEAVPMNSLTKDARTYRYYLRSGLNSVTIPESGTVTLCTCANTEELGLVTISELKIVPTPGLESQKLSVLNPALGIKVEDVTAKSVVEFPSTEGTLYIEEQDVLDTLRDMDPAMNFLTTVDTSDQGVDLMANSILHPTSWFDPQNVCNKFVVTALDTDFLEQPQAGVSSVCVSRLSLARGR